MLGVEGIGDCALKLNILSGFLSKILIDFFQVYVDKNRVGRKSVHFTHSLLPLFREYDIKMRLFTSDWVIVCSLSRIYSPNLCMFGTVDA
jgi:hypothetical protein